MKRRTMLKFLLSVPVLGLSSYIFLQQKIFGKAPSGFRLDRILKSSNYRNGIFQNLSPTEVMPKEFSKIGLLKKFISKSKNNVPQKPIPSLKTYLKNLSA